MSNLHNSSYFVCFIVWKSIYCLCCCFCCVVCLFCLKSIFCLLWRIYSTDQDCWPSFIKFCPSREKLKFFFDVLRIIFHKNLTISSWINMQIADYMIYDPPPLKDGLHKILINIIRTFSFLVFLICSTVLLSRNEQYTDTVWFAC